MEDQRQIAKISPKQLLEMPPMELAHIFIESDEQGGLEEFLKKIMANDCLIALFSYWEKWLRPNYRNLLDKAIEAKKNSRAPNDDILPLGLEKKFTPEQLGQICRNLGSIQLTFGCSYGCKYCALDAVPGVREHIPFTQLTSLFQQYGQLLGRDIFPILYHASEPSDYRFEKDEKINTYENVHALTVKYGKYTPGIVTRNNTKSWEEYLATAAIKHSISKRALDKGIGLSILEEKSQIGTQGIGCFNGTLLTPRGLYNIVQVTISMQYPQGIIVIPINNIASDIKIKRGDSLLNILPHVVVKFVFIRRGNNSRRYLMVWSGKNLILLTCDNKLSIEDFCIISNPSDREEAFIAQENIWCSEIKLRFPANDKMEKFYNYLVKLGRFSHKLWDFPSVYEYDIMT